MLDRGFAQLVADAMQPHLKRAVDDAMSEYMGQNGDTHRKDHRDLREFLIAMAEERETKKKRWESVRTHVIGWSIVAAISGVIALSVHWVKTSQEAPAVKERSR